MLLRNATGDDFRRYFEGREPPEAWWGVVAEYDEDLVAIGTVTWRWHGVGIPIPRLIAWCSLDATRSLPPMTMHRTARRTLDRLRELGEPVAYCLCNYDIPGAEAWLQRLGFVPDPNMTIDYGSQVWSVRLADG